MEINDKNNNLKHLISLLHTKKEADQFLTQVDILSELLFTNKAPLTETVTQLFSSDIAVYLKEMWKNAAIDGENILQLQNYLTELKESIKNTPVLNITIAFKPKQRTTQRIFDWVQSKIKQPILLNIKVEREIIGGAVIEFHGKHFEYTIHKSLVENIHNG